MLLAPKQPRRSFWERPRAEWARPSELPEAHFTKHSCSSGNLMGSGPQGEVDAVAERIYVQPIG